MNILGITGFFHDPSAGLLVDGKLVAFVEEERLVRIKHATGAFPERSIEFCLQTAGISFGDLDAIVCEHDLDLILSHDPEMDPYRQAFKRYPGLKERHRRIFEGAKARFLDFASRKRIRKAVFAPHHHTHLATAYYGSGFGEALALSIDGRGDTQSAVLAHCVCGQIRILDEIPLPSSLGLLYASVTRFLGYKPFDGEGTVMGLAAYGTDCFRACFDEWVGRRGHRFVVEPDAAFNALIDPFCGAVRSPLESPFGSPRRFNPDPRNGVDENIAASLQACVERAVSDYLRHYIEATGVRKLCLAGGVALNSKMNGQLFKQLELEDIYAFPVASDAGCAIGAAMWYAKEAHGQDISPISHAYFGPAAAEDQILAALDKTAFKVEEPENIAESAAALLADHKIVGWFQGRMEGGPRALGARSILSNPTRAQNKNAVNIGVKFREPWRPFAPSILYEKRQRYTGSLTHAPFMTVTFEVPEPARAEIPGAIHVDNTIRVQTVKREDNPLYYEVISAFESETGTAALTNTSFNRKGEPIVNSPAEALAMFAATEMDALAIGPYLVNKKR
jgi:carbamoyltransferase